MTNYRATLLSALILFIASGFLISNFLLQQQKVVHGYENECRKNAKEYYEDNVKDYNDISGVLVNHKNIYSKELDTCIFIQQSSDRRTEIFIYAGYAIDLNTNNLLFSYVDSSNTKSKERIEFEQKVEELFN